MLSCFSHVQLCDPMDHSPPGSSIHGILHTRILEWVALPSFRGSAQPRDWLNPGLPHCKWILYQLSHQGSPTRTESTRKVTAGGGDGHFAGSSQQSLEPSPWSGPLQGDRGPGSGPVPALRGGQPNWTATRLLYTSKKPLYCFMEDHPATLSLLHLSWPFQFMQLNQSDIQIFVTVFIVKPLSLFF